MHPENLDSRREPRRWEPSCHWGDKRLLGLERLCLIQLKREGAGFGCASGGTQRRLCLIKAQCVPSRHTQPAGGEGACCLPAWCHAGSSRARRPAGIAGSTVMRPESSCSGRVEELPELVITASGEGRVGKVDRSASQHWFLLCRAATAAKKPPPSSLVQHRELGCPWPHTGEWWDKSSSLNALPKQGRTLQSQPWKHQLLSTKELWELRMLKKKEKKKGKQTNYLCRQQGRGGLVKGAATRRWQLRSSPVLPRQPEHPREPPQPLSRPVLCCTMVDSQNSVWIKSQVNKDRQPFVSLLHCDCNSPTNISHKMSFVLFPFFKFSIYLSFLLLPSNLLSDAQAGSVQLNSAPTRPAPTSPAPSKSALATPACTPPAWAGLCPLPQSCTPCTERTSEGNCIWPQPSSCSFTPEEHNFSFTSAENIPSFPKL